MQTQVIGRLYFFIVARLRLLWFLSKQYVGSTFYESLNICYQPEENFLRAHVIIIGLLRQLRITFQFEGQVISNLNYFCHILAIMYSWE
jgi:hypothetical protein